MRISSCAADPAAERYSLASLALTSAVTLAGNPRPVRFSVSAPAVDLDLKAGTLSVPALKLNAAGAVVNASVEGTKILDAMDLRGAVKLEPVALREVLPPLGIALPKTRDAKALSRIAVSSDFAYGRNLAQFEKLEAVLDDTHLKGSLALDTTTEAVKFALTVDTLDLDRYLPPPSPAGAPPPAAEPQPKVGRARIEAARCQWHAVRRLPALRTPESLQREGHGRDQRSA